jgi:hypothetical protein
MKEWSKKCMLKLLNKFKVRNCTLKITKIFQRISVQLLLSVELCLAWMLKLSVLLRLSDDAGHAAIHEV